MMARRIWSSFVRRDHGVALILVLAMVATMSVIAVNFLNISTRSLRISTLTQARLQVDWYIQGAEVLAERSLSSIIKETNGALTLATPGLNETLAFPIDGGSISALITDASNCFNLNSLARAPVDEIEAGEFNSHEAFTLILEALDFERFQAIQIADVIADWVDPDTLPRPFGAEDSVYATGQSPYLAANAPMADVSELLAIRGISTDIYRLIKPYVCVRPNSRDTVFNINTLQPDRAELLVPIFSGLASPVSIRNALDQRSIRGFVSLEEFLTSEGIALVPPEKRYDALMSLSSRYFELRGEVVYLDSAVTYQALFGVSSAGETTLLRRQYGLDR